MEWPWCFYANHSRGNANQTGPQQISRLTFLRKHITRVLSRPIHYPSPFSSFLSVEPPTLITWKCSRRIEHCPGPFDSDRRVFEYRHWLVWNLFGFREFSLRDISHEIRLLDELLKIWRQRSAWNVHKRRVQRFVNNQVEQDCRIKIIGELKL